MIMILCLKLHLRCHIFGFNIDEFKFQVPFLSIRMIIRMVDIKLILCQWDFVWDEI